MHVAIVLAALSLGLGATPIRAQTPPDSPPPPIPVEAWPIEKVTRLGQAIYRQDIAAARATDALMAHANGAPPAGLAGWIVVDDGPNQTVRFLTQNAEGLRARYDVAVSETGAGTVEDVTDGRLSTAEEAQFQARQTAARNMGRLRCAERYNAVVLDDPDGDGWLVWLLASTTDADAVPLGGHYRFRLSPDARTVIQRDQLSNACLTLDKRDATQDGKMMGLVVSHIVSPQPVETHVFLSMINNVPIYVSAGDKLWAVEGPRIREVDRAAAR